MEKEIYTCRFLTEIMPTPPKKPMSISYAARTGRCTAAGRTTLPPVWTRTTAERGAKYTRGRGPVELAYSEMFGTQSEAMHREAEIKKLSRPQKQALLDRQTGGEMLTVYDAADPSLRRESALHRPRAGSAPPCLSSVGRGRA